MLRRSAKCRFSRMGSFTWLPHLGPELQLRGPDPPRRVTNERSRVAEVRPMQETGLCVHLCADFVLCVALRMRIG